MSEHGRILILWCGGLVALCTLIAVAAGTTDAAKAEGPRPACRTELFDAKGYTLCEVAAQDDVRLWLRGADGTILGSFARVAAELAKNDNHLVFAMNAGMYHPDRAPVGLYVEEGLAEGRLITSAGPGNFGLLPNGVFCIHADGFAVIESRRFADAAPACRYATQSGPMLVIDGDLHPRFLPDSASRYLRNGVGVSADGTRAVFAISDAEVTFHEFGRLFRDGLGLPNALYFDGNISRLYAPDLGRDDIGLPVGPIVGLVSR